MQHWLATDPSAVQTLTQSSSPEAAKQEGETYKQLAAGQEALRHELDSLHKGYVAATAQAMAPFNAKFDALVRKVESQGGSFSDGEGFNVPDWAMAEWAAILQEKNRAYVGTICPQWFGSGGRCTAWLKRYKDHYVQKDLPAKAKYQARNAEIFDLAGRAVKDDMPKATLEAVKDYVDKAGRIYQQRWRAPLSL